MDIDRPEMNREVFIYKTSNIKSKDENGKDQLSSGYLLALAINPKWIKKDETIDWWKLSQYSSHQLNLTIPSWSYELIYDRDAMSNGLADEDLLLSMDGHHNRYNEDPNKEQRKFYTILLDFPEDHVFDPTVLVKDAKENIDGKLTPAWVKVNGKKQVKGYFYTWQIVTTHILANKKGKIEEKQASKQSAAAAALAELEEGLEGMNM